MYSYITTHNNTNTKNPKIINYEINKINKVNYNMNNDINYEINSISSRSSNSRHERRYTSDHVQNMNNNIMKKPVPIYATSSPKSNKRNNIVYITNLDSNGKKMIQNENNINRNYNNNDFPYNQEVINNAFVNPSPIRKNNNRNSLSSSEKSLTAGMKSKFKFLHLNNKNENKHLHNHHKNEFLDKHDNNDYIINIDNDIIGFSKYSNKQKNQREHVYNVNDCCNINNINYNKRRIEDNKSCYSNRINPNESYNSSRINPNESYNRINPNEKVKPFYDYGYEYSNNNRNNIDYDKCNSYKNILKTNKNIVNNYVNNNRNAMYKTNIIIDNESIKNDYYNHEILINRVPIKKYPHQRSQSLEESVILFRSDDNSERQRHMRFYSSNNDNLNYKKNARSQFNLKNENMPPYNNYDKSLLYNTVYNNERSYNEVQFQRCQDEIDDITGYNMNSMPKTIPKKENKSYIHPNNINIHEYEIDYNYSRRKSEKCIIS